MVNGVGQGPQMAADSAAPASDGFSSALDHAVEQPQNNNVSTNKQMTWLDLNTDVPLGGGPPHCPKGSAKGACSAAKKLKKQAKKQKPSKLKSKLMQFLKKVKRWNQKRKRQKKQKNLDQQKQNSKSDKSKNPR